MSNSTNGKNAFGSPGVAARWTSSAKCGVGTSLSPSSRVWFTLSHGIINEVYYPRLDQASIRDLGLIITDGHDFFSEEKRHAEHKVTYLAQGVPGYRLVNTCNQRRYRIEKEVITDPSRDVVLQRISFVPLVGELGDYRLYVLLAPHLGNRGSGNNAWVDAYKGTPMLFAQREENALALACSVPWQTRSAGYVGTSDGWQDLQRHKQMTWCFVRAENGNVALTGEVDLNGGNGIFLLALGFGLNPAEAGHRVRASMLEGFENTKRVYVAEWQNWQEKNLALDPGGSEEHDLYRISTAVLRTHEAKRFPGGIIASLAIPWGFAKGDDDLGGYHLVWPRDLVEAGGGFLAAGATDDARRVLRYLHVTQEADGHWSQNSWLDGKPYWQGVQMDETAFPILLVDLAHRKEVLGKDELVGLWPMVRQAAGFLVRNGPVSQQDRWEEDPGYSPFTLAVEIAALLAAADLADLNDERELAKYLRETADTWNDNVERWTYVTDTDLAHQVGVEGYYVRIAPPDSAEAASPQKGFVPIKNRPPGESAEVAANIVSPDALALVRFGLREPDDPRIVNTVKVIDELLKVETPLGLAWHRYNDDGYGEHKDGEPFDSTGVGRAWPLLTGERAHYELAAGRREDAERLLKALEAFANKGGMIPEQIWDAPDIPERELYCGRPSGSAMPLVWAHAEYIKLRRSLHDGSVFDLPPQSLERYVHQHASSAYVTWRFNHKVRTQSVGKTLRLETLAPARVLWSIDNWQTNHANETRDTSLGLQVVDLPTSDLQEGATVSFTFYWPQAGKWERTDYEVRVERSLPRQSQERSP